MLAFTAEREQRIPQQNEWNLISFMFSTLILFRQRGQNTWCSLSHYVQRQHITQVLHASRNVASLPQVDATYV